MNGRYLLDTNIIIALFDEDKKVIKRVNQAREVYLPAIVIGELYYGAYYSKREEENVRKIDNLRTEVSILHCDDSTAKIYGQIKTQLRKKGKPIPENDLWIAATALQYDLTLAARARSHLNNILWPANGSFGTRFRYKKRHACVPKGTPACRHVASRSKGKGPLAEVCSVFAPHLVPKSLIFAIKNIFEMASSHFDNMDGLKLEKW